jgi:chromosome segregation ATPase
MASATHRRGRRTALDPELFTNLFREANGLKGRPDGASRPVRATAMNAVLTTHGQALRDTVRAWHAERDAIDSQLSESFEALVAYQSHLDEWQQQLARERQELQAAKEQFEQGCNEAGNRGKELQREQEELRAARATLDAERETLSAKQAELERERADLLAVQVAVKRGCDELDVARRQLENDRGDAESTLDQMARERSELGGVKAQLESERNDLRTARGKIDQERDELLAERKQLERDRAAMEKGQSEGSATLTAELNAAREKITTLSTTLLARTDELRTLDNRRSEALTEMELVRAREKELKVALEELKRINEQERANWKEELRQLRELLGQRVEKPAPAATPRAAAPLAAGQSAAPVRPSAPSPSHAPAAGSGSAHVIPRENPVLGSIVQQFDKLRQQRASDRNAANKPR